MKKILSLFLQHASIPISAKNMEAIFSIVYTVVQKRKGLLNMKKQLKKWLAILIAGTMVFAMPLAVVADGTDYNPPGYDDENDGGLDIPDDVPGGGADEGDCEWVAICPDYPNCDIPYCSVCNEFPPLDCEWPENPYCDCDVCDADYDAVDVLECDRCGYDPCVCEPGWYLLPPENLEELLEELQELREEAQAIFDAIFANPELFPYANWDHVDQIYFWLYWDWADLYWLIKHASDPYSEEGVTWAFVVDWIDFMLWYWSEGFLSELEHALFPYYGGYYCYGCDDEDCPLCFEQPGDGYCDFCGQPWEDCDASECFGQLECGDCGNLLTKCDCFYCFVCEAELPEDCTCEVLCPYCYCDCEWDDVGFGDPCPCTCDDDPVNDGPINDDPENDEDCDCGPFECCPKCCPICYPPEVDEEDEDKPESPQTGDAASAAPLVVSALMSISVFVGGTALKKKRD